MDKKSRDLVMAKLYLKNKDYKMAEKSFNEYLSLNPEDVAALKLLAQVHEHNKQFDKALEMYERCYLAEPDRTGVLLDICRILLMNEIWLEHVDYRKWLNLAIKAFPNNPIVVNFKSFLSTLPPEERNSPQRDVQPKYSSPKLLDDPLSKILDKLSLMESRLEKIENKINHLNISQTVQNQTTSRNQSFVDEKENKIKSPETNTQTPSAVATVGTTTPSVTPNNKLGLSQNVTPFSSFTTLQTSMPPTNPITNPSSTFAFSQTNLFANSMSKLNIPATGAWGAVSSSNTSTATTTITPANNTFSFPNQASNFTFSNNSPAQTATANSNSIFSSPTPFNFSESTNFFADSMKKLNLPTEGTWPSKPPGNGFSFSSPKQAEKPKEEAEDDNEEVVPNEELAIENTCDMTPIEIKTGEEDEDLVFEHRCKLFRLRDKEYKERGLGAIRVLKHKTTGKGRLIMRREAIGLVCLNCWNCRSIERVRETQVRWYGLDASDGEPELTVFLVKFKTPELTDTFMSHLTDLFSEDQDTSNTSASQLKPDTDKSKIGGPSDKPEIELVDPKLDPQLVDKARQLQLPDLFYHKLKNQDSCGGCNGCENDD